MPFRSLLALLCLTLCTSLQAAPPQSFSQAKKIGWTLYAVSYTHLTLPTTPYV